MATKLILNVLSAIVSSNRRLRSATSYVCNRVEGLQFGTYSLTDEAELAVSFLNNRSRGGVIIDAGANKGLYAIEILKSGANIKNLVLIEPQTALRDVMKQLADEYPEISFESVAIGSQSGTMDLYFDYEGSCLASLYERNIHHVGLTMDIVESVPITTLDLLVEKHALEEIDFLKLDLEGHELEALNGASGLLSERRIRAMTFEFGGCNIDSRTYIKDFWQLLVDGHGFHLYRLLPGRRLLQMISYSESLERFSWQNILACAPGVRPIWKIVC